MLFRSMELTGWSRKKSSLVNAIAIILLSLPCVLGYNVWSWDWLKVFGGAILDLEDFLVSNILLPLGSLVYLLFCVSKRGWGCSLWRSCCRWFGEPTSRARCLKTRRRKPRNRNSRFLGNPTYERKRRRNSRRFPFHGTMPTRYHPIRAYTRALYTGAP